MNADVEGDRPWPAPVVNLIGDAGGERVARPNDALPTGYFPTDRGAKQSFQRDVSQVRLISHLVVLLLLAGALLLGRLSWARWSTVSASSTQPGEQQPLLVVSAIPVSSVETDEGFVQRQMPPQTVDDLEDLDALLSDAAPDLARGGSKFVDAGFVTQGIDPEGSLVPVVREGVVTYTVRYGDTLSQIAQKFGVSQKTLWDNNDLTSPDRIRVGDQLIVPPVDGLVYQIAKGDTLSALAKRYRTTVEAIVNYLPNGLANGRQPLVGEKIVIPGGVKPEPVRPYRARIVTRAPQGALQGGGKFVMPVRGRLTQGFRAGHPAIDIAAPKGTPIYAADAGYVTFAGWHPWGYGYAVEIDHGNGYRTLYAHMSWYKPDAGQSVKRGELIGGVGSTYGAGGFSTGPHLHFEVIQNGAKRNPCLFVTCPF